MASYSERLRLAVDWDVPTVEVEEVFREIKVCVGIILEDAKAYDVAGVISKLEKLAKELC